ncbi:MAG: translocation/assembly module TamB domain-containing protein [Shimia sp.]|uniref:translocation/assembly module TamB domain-containing protein n=1 Tax=Shimia sp. TaxID=1954381 RepID=UPI0040582AEF
MRWLMVLLLALMPLTALAQSDAPQPEASEEDKGMLAGFIESSLSGAGRTVEVIGLRGAISSEASLQELRISDDEGLWLSLTDVSLNWNRLAVLRGDFEVNHLRAEKIVLARLPKTTPDPSAPKAQATPFSLPELPVSIDIADLTANRIEIGETVLGEAFALSLQARLVLADGTGDALFNAARLDGPQGIFLIDAAYANATRDLRLDLRVSEDQQGLISTLAKLPGEPTIAFTVQGEGPIDDFTADIRLATNGEDRVKGQVILATEPMSDVTDAEEAPPFMRTVAADLRGDIAPLFDTDFQRFFGTDIGLTTFARLFPDGRITLENLALWTASLNLAGDLELAANGMPRQFGLHLRMRDPENRPMLLPVSGKRIYLDETNLTASFDANMGDRWTLDGTITGLETAALGLNSVELSGRGAITPQSPLQVSANLLLDMAGLRLEDAGLSQAVGTDATLSADLIWNEGADLELTSFDLRSGDLGANGNAVLSGFESSMAVEGSVQLNLPDAARFSALAGRDLGGALDARIDGRFAALDGVFDADLTAQARDLVISVPQVDALAKGDSKLIVSASRDFDGLNLRNVSLKNDAVDVGAQGTLSDTNGDIQFFANLTDAGLVLPDISGPADFRGRAQLIEGDWQVEATANAPADSKASVRATLPADGALKADIDLTLGRVENFFPTLPGAARVKGTVAQDGTGWQVALDATGPAGSALQGNGLIDPAGSKNALQVTGSLPLAAANRALAPNSLQGTAQLDMRLNGPLDLNGLDGTVSLVGARLALPDLRIAFSEIAGTVQVQNAVAAIDMTSTYSHGGQFAANGTVGLTAPFNANLPVRLIGIKHREGQLLETSAEGEITLSGPLTGGGLIAGDLVLGQTDIRISAAALGGAGAVPDITHIGEPSSVRTTRLRAGVLKTEKPKSATARPFGLDVTISTGERISISGLGLASDFEGALTVGGTTDNVIPEGGLELIRGRMNLLGKSLELDEGRVTLAGGFVPTVRIVATSEQTDATIRLTLEGSLEAPEITLSSDPELPEDEVLSQLLFGRDISSISPLQALQLATTLASLSGGAGGGGLFSLTTDGGTAGLSTSGYLNENLYTEVGVDSEGKSTIDLNLDVNDKVTVKGMVNSDSETGIGIFYQRDY